VHRKGVGQVAQHDGRVARSTRTRSALFVRLVRFGPGWSGLDGLWEGFFKCGVHPPPPRGVLPKGVGKEERWQ
jgi:hypothetical protein